MLNIEYSLSFVMFSSSTNTCQILDESPTFGRPEIPPYLAARAGNWVQLLSTFATFPTYKYFKQRKLQKRAKEESNVDQISCFTSIWKTSINQFDKIAKGQYLTFVIFRCVSISRSLEPTPGVPDRKCPREMRENVTLSDFHCAGVGNKFRLF